MNEEELRRRMLELMERFELSDVEIAGLTTLAPQTVRIMRLTKTLPHWARCRRKIRGFVERNRNATDRAELLAPSEKEAKR
jgi:hypothetical protein